MVSCVLVLASNISADIRVRVSAHTDSQEWYMDDERHTVEFVFDDSPADRRICIELSGKTEMHTQINADGEIIKDAQLQVQSIAFDGIDVTYVFCQGRTCYFHDGNGVHDAIWDDFFGIMGCNGHVNIDLQTPIRSWFLSQC